MRCLIIDGFGKAKTNARIGGRLLYTLKKSGFCNLICL